MAKLILRGGNKYTNGVKVYTKSNVPDTIKATNGNLQMMTPSSVMKKYGKVVKK